MNRIISLTVSCILAVLVCFSQPIMAHEFIVKPSSFTVEPGEQIEVEVLSVHAFIKSEEMEPIGQVEVFSSAANGNRMEIPLVEEKDKLMLRGNAQLATKAAIIAGHRKGMIWSKTTQGWKQESKKNLTGVLSSGKYEKFSKALVTTEGEEAILAEPLGHRLEIIPLENHRTIQPGDELRCQILFDGQPLATEVMATYAGFSNQPDTYAYYSKSDDTGEVAIKITEPGIWVVRVQHETDISTADFDKEVLRAVLLFSIES
ncbi:MAG: DUF4198 domain-containing protein [Desulfocapsaceae bacterium]|nr:DUF4198 domain-containing protein [Desulfocapsaceae bacterium]